MFTQKNSFRTGVVCIETCLLQQRHKLMKSHKGRLEGTTISVDNFKPDGTITHYFLTHGHKDHCTGLTPTWNYNRIYTTTITKKYIIDKYKGLNPDIVIELKVGKTTNIPMIDYGRNHNKNENNAMAASFTVTPIN